MTSTNRVHNNIAILISPGFAENDVVYCLSQMRMAGLPTSLVGISLKPTQGQYGLKIVPDYSLNALDSQTRFHLIIVPGSYECVTNIIMSPGFHEQIKKHGSLAYPNGRIAILAEAETALQQANVLVDSPDKILRQGDLSLELFCQQLIRFAQGN